MNADFWRDIYLYIFINSIKNMEKCVFNNNNKYLYSAFLWNNSKSIKENSNRYMDLAFVPIYPHCLVWTYREGALKHNAYNEIHSVNFKFCQDDLEIQWINYRDLELNQRSCETPLHVPRSSPNCRHNNNNNDTVIIIIICL